MKLQLCFGPTLVGEIENAFRSDGTGYGVFRPRLEGNDSSLLTRIREYIAFSEEWHARLKEERAHSAEEWSEFRDIVESGQWRLISPDGTESRIGGPVFVEGEITWRAG